MRQRLLLQPRTVPLICGPKRARSCCILGKRRQPRRWEPRRRRSYVNLRRRCVHSWHMTACWTMQGRTTQGCATLCASRNGTAWLTCWTTLTARKQRLCGLSQDSGANNVALLGLAEGSVVGSTVRLTSCWHFRPFPGFGCLAHALTATTCDAASRVSSARGGTCARRRHGPHGNKSMHFFL